MEESLSIEVSGGQTVTAVLTLPEGPLGEFMFIYAPGAGSNVNDGFGSHLSHTLGAKGISTVRFQFPYMEAPRRRPDSKAVLEDTWRSVIKEVGAKGLKLVIGGRSMGGRIASQVVAQDVDATALALFAYPLHPPGKPSQWRDEHRVLGLSFNNKSDFSPLQAADILAYELHKEVPRQFGNVNRKPRYPLMNLGQKKHEWHYITNEHLMELNEDVTRQLLEHLR